MRSSSYSSKTYTDFTCDKGSCAASSVLDPVTKTSHPFLASAIAMPSPIPLVDPVTKAALPVSDILRTNVSSVQSRNNSKSNSYDDLERTHVTSRHRKSHLCYLENKALIPLHVSLSTNTWFIISKTSSYSVYIQCGVTSSGSYGKALYCESSVVHYMSDSYDRG